MENLKPCPSCGSNTIRLFSSVQTGNLFCGCDDCNMAGPQKRMKDNAALAWNTLPRREEKDIFQPLHFHPGLPRRLRWTKEKPTHSEIYYFRNEDGKCLADVNIEEGTVLLLNWDAIANLDELEGEWAGPIPEPEES